MDRNPRHDPAADFPVEAPESDLGPWEPRPRTRSLWTSPALAAGLAALLVVVVAAALVLPGLDLRPGVPGDSPSPSPSAVAASPSGSVRPTFVRPTPTPLPTFVAYLVKPGDSLNSIADEFATTARSIAFWNRDRYPNLDPESPDYEPDNIQIGWQLQLIPGMEFDEDSLPSRPPASPPASSGPTPSPSGTLVPLGPAAVVSHGPRDSDQVALTFDMGGRLDPALDIMNWLVANRVKATIFPTGKTAAETEIGHQVLDIVATHPDLFAIGNHSWDHPDFTDLSDAEVRDQLDRSEAAVAAAVGRSTRPWFRPPFGAWDAGVRNAVGNAGWSTIVMWDIDTIDWRPESDGGPTAAGIQSKVVSNAQGGSIVLMHLGGYNTLEALPGMVDGLTDKGLRAVTLADMLGE